MSVLSCYVILFEKDSNTTTTTTTTTTDHDDDEGEIFVFLSRPVAKEVTHVILPIPVF